MRATLTPDTDNAIVGNDFNLLYIECTGVREDSVLFFLKQGKLLAVFSFVLLCVAADIAKGVPGARDQDDRMAEARRKLDWEAQFKEAMDPETAKAIRDSRAPEDDHSDTCSMCGKFCAVRSMNKALAGEYIDIL